MIWNVHFETMGRAELERFQGERLGELVDRLYRRVPFYRRRMEERGVKPADINRIADIVKLPFLTKDDMREVYPLRLLAVDLSEIVEVHTSSGTTGKPVVDAYTSKDIDIWSEAMARTLAMGDTDARGHGAERLWLRPVHRRPGRALRRAADRRQRHPHLRRATPTASSSILQGFQGHRAHLHPLLRAAPGRGRAGAGARLPGSALRVGLFGAESWSESMRAGDRGQDSRLKALDIYGLTEIIGPGVASECEAQDGLHVFEDLFYPEIIDPETGQVLPDGDKGELVLTTLTKEGTPMLRYRTRDITYLDHAPCRCGRTSVRMHRLLGRTDDMLIIRGVNVFPSQIEEVLLRHRGRGAALPAHRGAARSSLDSLEVQVEMNERLFSDEIKQPGARRADDRRVPVRGPRHPARVKLVEPKSIPRSEGKAKRVVDKRQL